MADDRSAALLIRVWLESADAFRARLTTFGGADEQSPAHEVTVAVASTPAAVLEAVRAWLESSVGDRSIPVDGDG